MIDDFTNPPPKEPVRLDNLDNERPRQYENQVASRSQIPNGSEEPVRRPAPAFRAPEQVVAADTPTQPGKNDSAAPDTSTADETGDEIAVETTIEPTGEVVDKPAVDDTADVDTAASEEETVPPPAADPPEAAPAKPAKSKSYKELLLPAHASKPKWYAGTVTLFGRWTVSKKKLLIAGAATALLLIGGGSAFVLTRGNGAKPQPVASKKAAAPVAKPIVSPLTGLTVTAEQRDRPVEGVMIENSPDARPQSGLKDAGVVYEAIAEAGITRFLALFQEQDTANIGPIRSSRPYYLDWAMAFDASYAHVGGSPDALQRIKDINVKDLDQFYNPDAYHRITTRYAPHNVYSSVPQLRDLAISKGYDKSSFTSFTRKAEQPYKAPAPTPSPTPAAKSGTQKTPATKPGSETRTPASSIDFGISSAQYNAHYDYDPAANNYKRSEGGAAHMDADSNTQLTPKVVMALVMPYSLMADGYHSQYNTIGTGKAYVFQDGTVMQGTWTKGQPKDQFVFKYDNGKPVALDPGQTWISVVADSGKVTYK